MVMATKCMQLTHVGQMKKALYSWRNCSVLRLAKFSCNFTINCTMKMSRLMSCYGDCYGDSHSDFHSDCPSQPFHVWRRAIRSSES